MRVMSAGQGYKYLLRSVAAGDGDRAFSTPLTRYYAEAGTPPGRWAGTGITGIHVDPSAPITEPQLRALIGAGQDPGSGEQLGRPYRTFATVSDRVSRRMEHLPDGLSDADRALQSALIETEERRRPPGSAVAGFDLTFSVPKSVSTLWGVSDAGTQALIVQAHHAAMQDVLDLIERDVARTRVGALGPRGAVAQVPVRGVIGTVFDHYDSRASDPQLHTHVVLANRVQGAHDGKWRTLDSRALHGALTGISEHYNALLSDHLARALNVAWEARDRGEGRMTAWEITAVPQRLMDEFSSRTRDIERTKERLVNEYVAAHGRAPSPTQLWRIRQQATLETRPPKQHLSLADLTSQWRRRARTILGQQPEVWVRALLNSDRPAEALLRADDVPLEEIEAIARQVVHNVADRRSTWRRWNLHAEAVRQTMPARFQTTNDREAVIGLIVDAAENGSLQLTPPELASSPQLFQRADGSSVFRPEASIVYSSEDVLAAEDRLLALGNSTHGPSVSIDTVEHATTPRRDARRLGADQRDAIARVAVSGRILDVLVGPAGAGKTTALGALRQAWEREHGAGSVVALAPSAAAAAVLGDDLGVTTENTAKWLHEHRTRGLALHHGQLMIIDEASLAGTFALDELAAHAEQAGAKILLVGDYAQLQAVDAGGAFGMLVRERDDAPELVDVRRFRHDWEKHASLQLRLGDPVVVDTYIEHNRVIGAPRQDVLETAYRAWRADRDSGQTSILVAETSATVIELNDRARADRILAGDVAEGGVRLHDGTAASVGDVVISRRNNRRLAVGRGWVKNNDRWIVTAASDDGSLTVRREHSRLRPAITLPAPYVAEHVELGYAITAHRAQGITVDTAHAVVASPETTREALYVAMTRGREANTVYVATDQDHLEEHQHREDLQMTARSILFGVLQHSGEELSAHETIIVEQEDWGSIRQLAAEYDTIAQTAQHDRWVTLLRDSGLDEPRLDEFLAADSYGVLAATLRRLEGDGHNIDALVPAIIQAGGLADTEDLGSLLRARLLRATARYTPAPRRQQLIVGLLPRAQGRMEPTMRAALQERERLIVERAAALAESVDARTDPWARRLAPAAADDIRAAARRRHALVIVAAYRDLNHVTTPTHALGPMPDNDVQRLQYARAQQALTAITDSHDGAQDSTQRRSTGRQSGRTL